MTELLLTDGEQAAVRAVMAAEPLPGTALPGECALPALARLIACDASGVALLDAAGSALKESSMPVRRGTYGQHPASDGLRVGVHRRRRPPTRTASHGARGLGVLSLGVRLGSEHVVTLWMVRRTADFSDRDLALLVLVAPALERLMRQRTSTVLPPSLTQQERRVLSRVAEGLSNAEIAERLVIAPCTVRKHLENAYRKLGVTNRLAAVLAVEGRRLTGEELGDRAAGTQALVGPPA